MKERPILFNGPMVRAILDGSKTQTRRIMKHQPVLDGNFWRLGGAGWSKGMSSVPVVPCHSLAALSPYGMPRDRLWVRESFRFTSDFDTDSPARVGERCLAAGYKTAWAPIQYDADGSKRDWGWVGTPLSTAQGVTAGRTRASMHMPRWASRSTLEVTGVRVERLQAISDADCVAEGIGLLPSSNGVPMTTPADETIPRAAYRALWDSIAAPGADWAANPWVWVVEFQRKSVIGVA